MPLPFATDGSVALIPPRIALILEQRGRLDELRMAVRGRDPELASVLFAIHAVALQYDPDASADGSNNAPGAEPSSSSTLMTATEVADREDCTARAVRLARQQGRLDGTRVGDRWLFDQPAVAAWRATRRSTR